MSEEPRLSPEAREKIDKIVTQISHMAADLNNIARSERDHEAERAGGKMKPGVMELYEVEADLEELAFDRLVPLIEEKDDDEQE